MGDPECRTVRLCDKEYDKLVRVQTLLMKKGWRALGPVAKDKEPDFTRGGVVSIALDCLEERLEGAKE